MRRESPGSLLPSLQLKRLLRAEGRVVRGLDHPQTPLPAQKAGGPAALSKHRLEQNSWRGEFKKSTCFKSANSIRKQVGE